MVQTFLTKRRLSLNMKHFQILNTKEKKRLEKILEKQFGYPDKLEFVVLLNQKNRLYIIHRDVFDFELDRLRIDTLGMYFGTYVNNTLRLSIEGSQLIGPKCTTNILDLSKDQMQNWMNGVDLEIDAEDGFYIVKHITDFLGSGRIINGKLFNYVPKTRRLQTA